MAGRYDVSLLRLVSLLITLCQGDLYTRARASLAELKAFEVTSSAHLSKPNYEETLAVAVAVVSELAASVDQTASAEELDPILSLIDSLHTAIAQAHPGPSRSNSRVSGLGIVVPDYSSSLNSDPHLIHESPTEESSPVTPRVDKGKARAEPEPEVVEKVLSPNYSSLPSSDSDEEDESFQDAEDGQSPKSPSPNDMCVFIRCLACVYPNFIMCRSKSWVEEEGEVFRKGTVLLSQEELETDHDSDALRKEVRLFV